MYNQEKFEKDLLSQYINPEKIEKAPEGFTEKVMNSIHIETKTYKATAGFKNKSLIPVISVVVTISLVVAAILIPGDQNDPLVLPLLELMKNIRFSLPVINFISFYNFNVPALMIYVLIGISVLSLFDRALYELFHREK
jgi:hypothetical protein